MFIVVISVANTLFRLPGTALKTELITTRKHNSFKGLKIDLMASILTVPKALFKEVVVNNHIAFQLIACSRGFD